jgi:hypothetical protein
MVGCRHQVDRRLAHSRPKAVVVTKSTKGRHTVDRRGCRPKLTRGHHTVDQWGCRHQFRKMGMSSVSQQEVVTQSTEGVGTPSPPKERGHQVNPRSGNTKSTKGGKTPSQPKEQGHKVNQREEGDTKSTHEERETQSQPTENGRGHQVNLWKIAGRSN